MNRVQLQCKFATNGEKPFILRLNGVKEGLEAAEVGKAMSALIDNKVFGPEDLVKSLDSAKLVITTETALI